MSFPTIRQLLESRLMTWAGTRTPALSVQWENKPFSPPAGPYLRFFIIPAPTEGQALDGTHRAYTGSFQVSIVTPKNQGSEPADSIAVELEALFPDSLRLENGSFVLTQTSPISSGPPIQESDRYTVPLFAFYRADTITNE